MGVLRFTHAAVMQEGEPPVSLEVHVDAAAIEALIGHPEGPTNLWLRGGARLVVDQKPSVVRERWTLAAEAATAPPPPAPEPVAPPPPVRRWGAQWDPDLGPPSDQDLERAE